MILQYSRNREKETFKDTYVLSDICCAPDIFWSAYGKVGERHPCRKYESSDYLYLLHYRANQATDNFHLV